MSAAQSPEDDRAALAPWFHTIAVHDVGALAERFDVVLFMGVLYHLRHPLLALDLSREQVAADLFVFQPMLRGALKPLAEDYDFWEMDAFERPGYPRLHFVEREYAHDWTNWWIPDRAGIEAMLRAAGFRIESRPGAELYICRSAPIPYAPGAVYPARALQETR